MAPSQLTTEDLRAEVERLRQELAQEEAASEERLKSSPGKREPMFGVDSAGNFAVSVLINKLEKQIFTSTNMWQWYPEGLYIFSNLGSNAIANYKEPIQGIQTLDYSNGDQFKGETLDNMRHGNGKHVCSNGDQYDGSWKYDKRDGQGKMVFKRGVTYDGKWKEDKAHGMGVCVYENGSRYEGEFLDDKRGGWGVIEMKNGEQYEGEWEQDAIQGQGRWTYPDGSFFEGLHKDNERVSGRFESADAAMSYTGQFCNGLRHGRGVFHQKDCYQYSGDWHEDLRHGEGCCKYVGGAEYTGEWRKDLRDGKGILKGPGEYKYDGEWIKDEPEGQGTCRLHAGDWYSGSFKKGTRQGLGRCIFSNGEKYIGKWRNDKKHGQGKLVCPSGEKYSGEWKDGMRHGSGKCTFADGTKFHGMWENDCWLQTAADPATSKATGAGLRKATAGKRASFYIEARDENNNRRLSGGDEIRVVLCDKNGNMSFGEVQDKEDGTYEASYICTLAGSHSISIFTGEDELLAGSPYTLQVEPGPPYLKRSTLEGTGRREAICGQEAFFYIVIRDQFGNCCPQDPGKDVLEIQVELSSVHGPCEISVSIQDDGEYICKYIPKEPVLHRLAILSGGKYVAGSPFSVSVCVSDPSGDKKLLENRLLKELGPVEDEVTLWGNIARKEYARDGEDDGWDSDAENEGQDAERKILQAHPDVPVVENLEDLWMLSKLQQDRKKKEQQMCVKRVETTPCKPQVL